MNMYVARIVLGKCVDKCRGDYVDRWLDKCEDRWVGICVGR